ncbi:beta-ketoacyl-ACP synthase II [Candidatus Zixiibacteriota bacterium]
MKRRVVITGLGTVAPTGLTVPEVWKSALQGRSGLGPISRFDSSDLPTRIAGEVKEFDPSLAMDQKEIRRSDLFLQFANVACNEALEDSGLDMAAEDPYRVGVVVASGIGGIQMLEDQSILAQEKGLNRVSPFFVPMMIIDMAAGDLSIRHGMKGPNYATVSACASAGHALLDSFNLIQLGYADVMVAGGSEAPITPLATAGFARMKAMSTRNDEPERASRPFDSERDGFVMGEGASILILETLEHARARGAKIYAEFLGGGMTADAYHMTAPDENGRGGEMSMRIALEMADLGPEDVDYINAHGTSTPLNDAIESKSIRRVFGDHADSLSISSTKSMTGHLLGASGALEFMLLTLTLQEGEIPPTINYENPDPDCTLNYTPNASVKRALEVGLSNSFGFGGHNVTLAARKFHEEA